MTDEMDHSSGGEPLEPTTLDPLIMMGNGKLKEEVTILEPDSITGENVSTNSSPVKINLYSDPKRSQLLLVLCCPIFRRFSRCRPETRFLERTVRVG